MKKLCQLCAALVFIIALTIPAFAGEIETGKVPPTPPAAVLASEIETGITGQVETGSSEATATDSATQFALNLLQSMLLLF